MKSVPYIEYESTHPPFRATNGKTYGSDNNSYTLFRKDNTPTKMCESDINEIIKAFTSINYDHYTYYPEFKQLYVYMWNGNTVMSFNERKKSNLKKIIIDMYDERLFVAICDNKHKRKETHYLCDKTKLKQLLIDKSEEINQVLC